VAKALANLPQIDAAFASGDISYSKVRAMTRTATPENEATLLNVAKHGTAQHVERLVRHHRRVQRLNSGDDSKKDSGAAQHAARELNYYYDDDGMLVIRGRFAPEEGAVIVKALEAGLDSLQQDERRQSKEAKRGECLAGEKTVPRKRETDESDDHRRSTETFLQQREGRQESSLSGQPALDTLTETPERTQPEITFPQKRADALSLLVETFLATGGGDGESASPPLGNGDKYQIMVHLDHRAVEQLTLTGCHSAECNHDDSDHGKDTDQSPHAHLEAGPPLPRSTLRRLACDAALVPVLRGDDGKVLNIGRKSRAVPPAMRRALNIRDGGCRYPGCCQTRYVDAHHIHHWCDGGETRLDNLVLLCRHHHRLLHEGGFSIGKQPGASAGLRFVDKAGREIRPALYPQFAPGTTVSELEESNRHRGLTIDARTAVTAWRGERMDYGMAIDALLWRDGGGAGRSNRPVNGRPARRL